MRLIMEIVRRIKRLLKMHHLLPIYPIDILMEIKNNLSDTSGLCHGIILAEKKFNLHEDIYTQQYIKNFDIDIAIHNFGGRDKLYWWEPDIWYTGRLDFLNFLIEENKNNKIDLRKAY